MVNVLFLLYCVRERTICTQARTHTCALISLISQTMRKMFIQVEEDPADTKGSIEGKENTLLTSR